LVDDLPESEIARVESLIQELQAAAEPLDANSRDYRYIQARRTLIYIEQSIKAALDQFKALPNDASTWKAVEAAVSSILQGIWSQGGLMGPAREAFVVQCNLSSIMTEQDIRDGYMVVQVLVKVNDPAEFIELIFRQRMEEAV
jgi:phage tail sheath protein FI